MNANELVVAVEAAFRAGEAILSVYESADFEVEHKADHSPLTLADRKAHRVIRDILSSIALPLLSEEGRQMPYEQRNVWERFWLVDPLDGTKEFIKRNGEFTVNIAIIEKGLPVLGVIYVPVQDRMFFGVQGQGAFRIDQFQSVYDTRPMEPDSPEARAEFLISSSVHLPERCDDRPTFVVVGSRSHASAELEAYVEAIKQTHAAVEFISAGSSLKFCLVAEGQADLYPRLGPTMEWDTAAGQAIAECAGAQVLDFETRQPLRYNKELLKNPSFLVIGANSSGC